MNAAWATQRWSRRVHAFDEIEIPENEVEKGSPEAWMDMRRFFSDGIAGFLIRLKDTVESAAPGVPHTSNHYSGFDALGFDYLKYHHSFVDYPGMGFYPDYAINEKTHYALTVLQERRAEFDRPMWCIEFISGPIIFVTDNAKFITIPLTIMMMISAIIKTSLRELTFFIRLSPKPIPNRAERSFYSFAEQ